MSNDHFVAQTYLRQWCDPKTGKLYGYSKTIDKEFPCNTKDVCHEWKWDTNSLFEKNPKLQGEFRKIFEPQWTPAIRAIRNGTLAGEDKFILSGYWALLTTCTPSWHRNAVDLYNKKIEEVIPMVAEHVAREKPEEREYIRDAIAGGKIKADVDPDRIKALLTQQLLQTTLGLFQQNWTIVKNSTKIALATSDNPSSVFPRRQITAPLIRYLPLAPDLGIIAIVNADAVKDDYDLLDISGPAPGTICRTQISRRQAARLNRVLVMNAGELVFTSNRIKRIRRLVRNHRKFAVTTDHIKIPIDNGFFSGAGIAVRQVRTAKKS